MLYRKRKLGVKIQTVRAIDVLYQKMNFYSERAETMALEIYKILKEDPKPRGDKLADMYKAMMRLNEIAIECAAKLAPYQSAKLESIEVKKTVEHRYVIAAPKPVDNSANWLMQVDQEAKLLPSPQKVVAEDKQKAFNIPKFEEAEIIPTEEENYKQQYLEAN